MLLKSESKNQRIRPPWPRKKLIFSKELHDIKKLLRRHGLRSVCEDAKCPNISECFGRREATFIIMGDVCTRRCSFCAIPTGQPKPLDPEEPDRLAKGVAEIGLKHVVITSVTRDDLDDGGAAHFANCVTAIRKRSPKTTVEVLTSDFKGNIGSLHLLAKADLQIFNHNLETTLALHPTVRPQAKYQRSLEVLASFKKLRPSVLTKSGIMLGLGETDEDVAQTLRDLRSANVEILTIGQYMQPKHERTGVNRYASLERFKKFETLGNDLGFRLTLSSPYVRSSFGAAKAAQLLGVSESSNGEFL